MQASSFERAPFGVCKQLVAAEQPVHGCAKAASDGDLDGAYRADWHLQDCCTGIQNDINSRVKKQLQPGVNPA